MPPSLVEFFRQGGILMTPLVLCSVIALAIGLERAINLRRKKIFLPQVVNLVGSLIEEGKLQLVRQICDENASPLANIIRVGIDNYNQEREEIKATIMDAGRQEVPVLEKNLLLLGTIAGISPLLGLLGTVTGMIKVFRVISVQGVGQAGALAGGISEALITTAIGLAIAVPALVAYNYFVHKVEMLILDIEKYSLQLVNRLIKLNSKNRVPDEAS
jgi:biopolymer transport protein ExbB